MLSGFSQAIMRYQSGTGRERAQGLHSLAVLALGLLLFSAAAIIGSWHPGLRDYAHGPGMCGLTLILAGCMGCFRRNEVGLRGPNIRVMITLVLFGALAALVANYMSYIDAYQAASILFFILSISALTYLVGHYCSVPKYSSNLSLAVCGVTIFSLFWEGLFQPYITVYAQPPRLGIQAEQILADLFGVALAFCLYRLSARSFGLLVAESAEKGPAKGTTVVGHNMTKVRFDRPLEKLSALQLDKFGRRDFAAAAVASLRNVGPASGFVISIEGAWGSGKTSALAMVEALLMQESTNPVVVHFNPWLIGDREALLRSFLARVSSEVELKSQTEKATKLAKELKAYSGVFDVLKLIPGAEPWASLFKSILSSSGSAIKAVADYKAPDVEAQKLRVEEALRGFPQPVIVIIDDIDRLFPNEVYEIARIVKAVGDFPNVGYVLAWDPNYVSEALSRAGVPQASSYLDKIVQVRLPLPTLSAQARQNLINEALSDLPAEATKAYFTDSDERLSSVYRYGLRDVLEVPRDFDRVFNTVALIEPPLRGEIVLADIIGLATVMVKAPHLFGLLCAQPRLFVGDLPTDTVGEGKKLVKEGEARRELALSQAGAPHAVKELMQELFPLTEGREVWPSPSEGAISSPARLLVALQLQVTGLDVSLSNARQFLAIPELRESIVQTLTTLNCIDFLERLGSSQLPDSGLGFDQLKQLCLDIAEIIDQEPFVARNSERNGVFWERAPDVAIKTLNSIITAAGYSEPSEATYVLAEEIASSDVALSVSVELFSDTYVHQRGSDKPLQLPPGGQEELAAKISKHVISAARDGTLWSTCNVNRILGWLPKISAEICPSVFEVASSDAETADRFALALFSHGFDSVKGHIFAPPPVEIYQAYASLEDLKGCARRRLSDPAIQCPAKAAWLAIAEDRKAYACDGTEPR